VREVDTLARLGGDEFVIILNRTSKLMVKDTAQRILDELTLTIDKNGFKLNVTASIGIAVYPDDCLNPKTLLMYADAAMYTAKNKGKCQCCWHMDLSYL
jgi:two-component system CheB/CheR fusion protein